MKTEEQGRNAKVIPTFEEIRQAHEALGAMLHNHFNGKNPEIGTLVPTPANKLMHIVPNPIKRK